MTSNHLFDADRIPPNSVLGPAVLKVHVDHMRLIEQFIQSKACELHTVFTPEQLTLFSSVSHDIPVQHMELHQFSDLLHQLINYFDDTTIPLQLASLLRTQHLGVLGYLLHAVATLGDALLVLKRYGKIFATPVENMEVNINDDKVHLVWKETSAGYDPAASEFSIAVLIQFVYQLVEPSALLDEDEILSRVLVKFYHHNIASLSAYTHYLKCKVVFGCPYVSLSFPLELLTLPTRNPDDVLLRILQTQAEQLLASFPSTNDFLCTVQQHLITLCQKGQPTLVRLAEVMQLGERTLQRRLTEQQTSFQLILDQTRQQLCMDYLDQGVQLIDIAYLLGYSDQSAFTRAYKRWTGNTPHHARRVLHDSTKKD